MNHIKNVFDKKIDDFTHKKFIRYGIGEYDKEEFIIKKGSSAINIWGGFEYLDVFQKIVANNISGPANIKGVIVSLTDIKKELAELGIEPTKVTGKKYTVSQEIDKETYKKMVDKLSAAFLLLAIETKDFTIKCKSSVPKPGNLAEKFCSISLPVKLLPFVIDEFLFDVKSDVKDFKAVSIKPKYEVLDIEIPNEKDPKLAREKAKRKTKITRAIKVDSKEYTKSFEGLI